MVMLRKGRYAGGGSDFQTSCSCANVTIAPCNNRNNHATAVGRACVSIEHDARIDNLLLQVVGLRYQGMKERDRPNRNLNFKFLPLQFFGQCASIGIKPRYQQQFKVKVK